MPISSFPKITSALAAVVLLFISVIGNFLAQNSQPSPSPSAEPSPVASVTPTPAPSRAPSPTPLPGPKNFHQWGSITLFNGLPSDGVKAISQTPDGVMWFGTDNGLARFDGRQLRKFSLGSPDADRIMALETSPSGELWVGTRAGAFVYSGVGFKAVEGTQELGVTAFLLGRDIVLGTDSGLAFRVRQSEGGRLVADKLYPEPILADDGSPLSVTSLVESEGRLIVGTSGRGAFLVTNGSISELQLSPRPIFVNALAHVQAGNLWLGTDAPRGVSGVFAVDGSRAVRVSAPTAKVLALEASESGLWVGTEKDGLFQIVGSRVSKSFTFENTSGGLRSNTIYSLFTDREGVLWIGTNRGVSRFDRLGPFQQTVSDIPNSNFIRTLEHVSDGKLYAGSNRGLFVQEANDRWSEVSSFRNKVVYALRARADGTMIVGCPDGIFDLSERRLGAGDVRSLAGFEGSEYAAVYGRGVIDISRIGQRLVFSNPAVTSVGAGRNKLWIGTAGEGLFSFDGTKIKTEATPETLKSGTIWKVLENVDGVAYIAGQHGVFAIHEGAVEQIAAAEDVRDVYVRDGGVWAATTTRGLLHARRDERFGWLVSTIGFEQGMPSEKAFSIVPSNDGLIVATNRGIVMLRSGTVPPRLIPVRLLSQRLHNLAELHSTVSLDYPQNGLVLEVAGQSSRTFPEEFQYGFLLRNAAGEAIESRLTNDPQYALANLKPGNYSIESIAFNRDLLASEPLTVRFSISAAPFPWTATALAVLLALAVIGLVWAIFEHQRIRLRNRELAAARFDLANEAERERRRIARDLHDQTLADLRKLMMASDKLLPNSWIRSEIETVSTDIRRICEDLSPSVLENVGLVAALEFLLSRTIENRRFIADETVEDRISLPMNVQLQIYRIAQEVLTNIDRHSDADCVEAEVELTDSHEFQLTIRDDGSTFRPGKANGSGRGVSNIRSRANLIGGKVAWKEWKDGGNEFQLRVPER